MAVRKERILLDESEDETARASELLWHSLAVVAVTQATLEGIGTQFVTSIGPSKPAEVSLQCTYSRPAMQASYETKNRHVDVTETEAGT